MVNDKEITIWQVFVEFTTGGFTRDEPIESYYEDLGLFITQNKALEIAKKYISDDLQKQLSYKDLYSCLLEPNWSPLKQLDEKQKIELKDKPVQVNKLWYQASGPHRTLYVRPHGLMDSLIL